jgi:hypothetical protein
MTFSSHNSCNLHEALHWTEPSPMTLLWVHKRQMGGIVSHNLRAITEAGR